MGNVQAIVFFRMKECQGRKALAHIILSKAS